MTGSTYPPQKRIIYYEMILVTAVFLFCCTSFAEGLFREVPQNESVLLGSDVTFRCVAQKSPNEYELYSQWRSSSGSLLGFHDSGQLAGHQGRYSYIKESPEELHLKIERVSLDDDGPFECQMLRPEEGPSRAIASLTVLVPPQPIYLTNYRSGATIQVNENTPLNLTCVAPSAKPAADVTWFINGRRIEDDVHKWNSYNLNKTVTRYASIEWIPRRGDHKKVLTCQVDHRETSTQLRTNTTLDIFYPPERPKASIFGGETFVRSGDNVTLVCVVSGGNPSPNVSWYLNNRAIATKYTYEAEIQETRNTYSFLAEPKDHQAPYECRASNREGVEPKIRRIQVKVAYAPQGVELFGRVDLRMGQSTSIQCRSKPSNPPSRVSWLVNGHPIPATVQSEHEQEFGTISISNLTINSNDFLTDRHRVSVECTVRNDEGATSKQHIIKILAPPNPPVVRGLEDATHIEGDVVNVTCEAVGGHPLADLSWYRGYEKLNGARSSVSGDSAISMISLKLDRSMNGKRLKCEAMNAALDEPLVASKQVVVMFPPRRVQIRTPDNTRHQLLSGKEARLLCSAPMSNPPSTISWQFHPNGETSPLVYTGETSMNETTRDSGYTVENTVTFTPTEAHDGTIVSCIASNSHWPISKNVTFPLNVFYAPRLLVDSPIGIVVSEGESFRENLTVKGNPPVSAWKWRKNGAPFDHTVGNVFARGATLSGRVLKSSDAGTYTLFAINSVGTANVTIVLTVEYSARIVRISSPIIASTGETVVLECEAEGEPRKSDMVNWFRNGEQLSSAKHGDTRAVLRVNASKENAGPYTCRAENGVGLADEKVAHLLVNSAPKLLHLPSLTRAAGPLGGRARARCRAVAVPDADFLWNRGGELIKGNSSKYSMHTIQLDYSTFESTLIIHNLVPEDFQRDISCTARNSLGTDTVKIPIGPQSPPDVPLDLIVKNVTSDSISISWTPGFDGGSDQSFEVRYQRDGEDVLHGINTTNTNLRLSGLSVARVYTFQVRALNARGFSSDVTRPALYVATLSEDGVDISHANGRKRGVPGLIQLLLIVAGTLLFMCNIIVCCFVHRKHRKKKIQEKTEMIRTAINGDSVRPVQMYGTMVQANGPAHCDDMPDISEDDHSVRTMIEVSPNGYLQQIDPMMYDTNCLVEYDFDPRELPHRHGTMGRSGGSTYTTLPYPEPPHEERYSDRSLSRRLLNNNNDHSPHHLSTFIQPRGVRTGPIHYSQLDGDLV